MFTFTIVNAQDDFETYLRKRQLNFKRVEQAYSDKLDTNSNLLLSKNINPYAYQIFLRAFKKEGILELWAKNIDDDTFTLITMFKFCSNSGFLGPKREQGDKQIPEGVYFINEFNPVSTYHLSMRISYPNKSDSIKSNAVDLGGDIYIHGGCETIGCIPITNDKIKSLYVYCIEAFANGQEKIPIHIFPVKLTLDKYKYISQSYNQPELSKFWGSLRSLYLYFETHHAFPQIIINDQGNYEFFKKD